MRALVTGATGFLGSHLVSLLRDKGYEVIALGRDLEKGKHLESSLVSFRSVDITCLDQLLQSFENVDVVFHCAAKSSLWGDFNAFHQVNVEGSLNLLQCCEKFAVKRLIYVSSTSVYFDFKDHLNLDESQALESGFANHYARSKLLGEKALLSNRKNTEVVIIRPRGIIGEGDTSIMPRILRIADKGYFPLIANGRAIVDLTYVKNVAYALYLAAEKPGLDGSCFNISNLEPMSVKSLLTRVLGGRKSQTLLIPVPYSVMYALAWTLEKMAICLHLNEPIITRYSVGLLGKSQTLDLSRARDRLGYEPLYSMDHAIASYLEHER
jgi:nucleoside-diphosphate-sugar epimerase